MAQIEIGDQMLCLTAAGAANLRKNTLAYKVLQKAEREWRAKHPDAPLYNTADTDINDDRYSENSSDSSDNDTVDTGLWQAAVGANDDDVVDELKHRVDNL
jgi:hypothetical protein